jgi:hypothetical protein
METETLCIPASRTYKNISIERKHMLSTERTRFVLRKSCVSGSSRVSLFGSGADAGTPDARAGAPDTGAADAGTPDAGRLDAGALDAGALDAGTPDAGAPCAGATCAGTSAALPDASCRPRVEDDGFSVVGRPSSCPEAVVSSARLFFALFCRAAARHDSHVFLESSGGKGSLGDLQPRPARVQKRPCAPVCAVDSMGDRQQRREEERSEETQERRGERSGGNVANKRATERVEGARAQYPV